MGTVVLVAIVLGTFLLLKIVWKKKKWNEPDEPFPEEWRHILATHVTFYNSLGINDKLQFEYKVQEFLLNCRITGIDTSVEITDKLLVAASAVIPVFHFPGWKYTNLYEVLLYPETFNESFETAGNQRNILGMVGSGYMNGKMILSKPALRQGFANDRDKNNTGIHEFVHLIDKMDGQTDGVPEVLLSKQYTIPWLDLMQKEIDKIYADKSDINPYGATNKAEFYSVASEYFFERPKLLKKKHPELYASLEKIFDNDLAQRDLNSPENNIGSNDPCPCGSGEKFKNCCGKEHFA